MQVARKEVIAKVQSYLKDATLKEELAEAYETLMKVSKDYQQKQIEEHKWNSRGSMITPNPWILL